MRLPGAREPLVCVVRPSRAGRDDEPELGMVLDQMGELVVGDREAGTRVVEDPGDLARRSGER